MEYPVPATWSTCRQYLSPTPTTDSLPPAHWPRGLDLLYSQAPALAQPLPSCERGGGQHPTSTRIPVPDPPLPFLVGAMGANNLRWIGGII